MLEDDDLVGGPFQQGVLRRLDGIGIADLAADDEAAATQQAQDAPQPLFGLAARLVDIAESVPQRTRLDRRDDHSHLELTVNGAADLVDRLLPVEALGDDRKDSVRHRAPSSAIAIGWNRLAGRVALFGRGGHALGAGEGVPGSALERATIQPANPPTTQPTASRVALRSGSRFSFEPAPWAVCFAVDLTARRASLFFSLGI
jgi:hypothetical protein